MLNIEFCHFYSHSPVSSIHSQSLGEFSLFSSALKKPYQSIIFIDDYKESLNEKYFHDFLKFLEKNESIPNFIIFESTLTDSAEKLIASFPSSLLKEEYFKKENKQVLFLTTDLGKIPLKEKLSNQSVRYCCPLLTASFYLTALGHISLNKEKIISLDSSLLRSDELLVILPLEYQSNEEKAKTILSFSNFSFATSLVSHHFFTIKKEELAI